MRGVVSRRLGLVIAVLLIALAAFVIPAPAAPVTATVPYSTATVADADLDGNPATGDWTGAQSWTVPLENGAAAPYGSVTLFAKHDGTYVYFRVDGKIDVLWVSSTGNHFWFGMVFTSSVTTHHSAWQDGVFFGEDSFTSAAPLVAIDTNGGGKPPAKDATQSDLGRMTASGSAAPYSFTAEWKRKLSTGDANDLTFVADDATSYYFYATSDSNGGGSGGGTINHKVTTNDNVMRFALPGGGDTTPPTVAVTSPADASTVNGLVTIAATAADDVGVAKVEFYADAALLGTDTSSPYSQTWDTSTAAQGSHQLAAKAYDAAGNNATASITVTVDHTARAVSITAPANNSVVTGVVTINATAADPGGVSRVDFYIDATLLGTDTTSPYTQVWDTAASPEGARTVTATGTFVAGGSLNATARITVDRTPPHAVAGPARSVTAGTSVTFDGSGSTDANGIADWRWEFDDGGPRVVSGVSPSYRFANVGSFLVNLTVTDFAGNAGTDATWVNVTARDTVPPSALDVPIVSTGAPGSVRVTWTASAAPDLAGYLVLRADSSTGPFIQLNAAPLQDTVFVDTGLEPGRTYSYEVVAVDASGNQSPPSPEASGMAGLNPPTPLDLLSLRWTLIPLGAGAVLALLGILAWRESRRARKLDAPPSGTPPPPEARP